MIELLILPTLAMLLALAVGVYVILRFHPRSGYHTLSEIRENGFDEVKASMPDWRYYLHRKRGY